MISVIVPIYNVENYLKPCLESISKETYQDKENGGLSSAFNAGIKKGIKDLRSYLLSAVSFLSPKLLYELCNRMSH